MDYLWRAALAAVILKVDTYLDSAAKGEGHHPLMAAAFAGFFILSPATGK